MATPTTSKAIRRGATFLVTGGGFGGIGFAFAKRLGVGYGCNVVLADSDADSLAKGEQELKAAGVNVLAVNADVADYQSVERLHEQTKSKFGSPDIVMLAAAVSGSGGKTGGPYTNVEAWTKVLAVNLMGVVHGIQVFAPEMAKRKEPGLFVCLASKQGITAPPGNTAYNVSKAGVKAATEGLAHQFRVDKSATAVHMLVPGWVFTKMTRGNRTEKPDGAWFPDQLVDWALPLWADPERFYCIAPDDAVTEEMDKARMKWSFGDIIENRNALSRWDSEHTPAFEEHMRRELGQ